MDRAFPQVRGMDISHLCFQMPREAGVTAGVAAQRWIQTERGKIS